MATRPFDCVRMKQEGAAAVQRELAGLSADQRLRFWQEQYEKLLRRRRQLRKRPRCTLDPAA